MLARLAAPVGFALALSAVLVAGPASSAPVPPRLPLCIPVPDGTPGDVAIINVTNTNADRGGFGALRASEATPIPSRPTSDQYSSVNFSPGPPNPNLAITTIGTDGEICYDSDGGFANLILDLVATVPAAGIESGDPQRLIDTRATRPVSPRTPLCLPLPQGEPGDAAIINITNTDASAGGFGALRPADAAPVPTRPAAQQYSSVNFSPGAPNPNLAIVAIGADRDICYDSDGATSNVILDLVATIPSANIDNGDPQRLVDTRTTRPVRPRTPLCITIPRGSPGDAAVINITNTNATSNGYGALRASDATAIPSRPTDAQYSSVNFAPGPANPNLAIVTIGLDGRVCYDSDGGTTDVILDLVATIATANIDNGEPERLVDTRPPPAPGVPSQPAAAPSETFGFLSELNGRPGRWNPCEPIFYRTNMSGATSFQSLMFDEALAQVEAATGLDFIFIGTFMGGTDDDFPLNTADAFFGVYPRSSPALRGNAGLANQQFVSDGRQVELVKATATLAQETPEFRVKTVWLHELGHVAGLGHVDRPEQVMFGGSAPVSDGYALGDLNGLFELSSAQGCVPNSRRR